MGRISALICNLQSLLDSRAWARPTTGPHWMVPSGVRQNVGKQADLLQPLDAILLHGSRLSLDCLSPLAPGCPVPLAVQGSAVSTG